MAFGEVRHHLEQELDCDIEPGCSECAHSVSLTEMIQPFEGGSEYPDAWLTTRSLFITVSEIKRTDFHQEARGQTDS